MRKNISSVAPESVHNVICDMQTALLYIIILYHYG